MNKCVLNFGDNRIRRVWVDESQNGHDPAGPDWFFSIVDIVGVLSESSISKRYWSDLKIKLKDEGFEAYDKIVRLKLEAVDGKMRETDCVNLEGVFRITQSIPSKKAEPFKLWLAKVGSERINEINRNVYKFIYYNNIDMLPGDLYGSPDEFFSMEVKDG